MAISSGRFLLIYTFLLTLLVSLKVATCFCPSLWSWSLQDRFVSSLQFSVQPDDSETESLEQESPPPNQRIRKHRESSKPRRPSRYWHDLQNLERELFQVWQDAGVSLPKDQPPPIPSETLLNYWKRHDIRGAIVMHEGRELLSEALGGAELIPGQWRNATQTPWVQRLLDQDGNLSPDQPPLSPQQLQLSARQQNHTSTTTTTTTTTRPGRKAGGKTRHHRGYWSEEVVIQELYKYLKARRDSENIPAVWMPRLSELVNNGYETLQDAIRRRGGSKHICRQAGLVPFREWNYMECMYDMLIGLKKYLDTYHEGDYTVFPVAVQVKERGYDRLWSEIQFFGGSGYLSSRLDMKLYRSKDKDESRHGSSRDLTAARMRWGAFDLVFGIELLEFVRNENLRMEPPVKDPELEMPTQLQLLDAGESGLRLDEKIHMYGGYENVARRLGLGWNPPRL